MECRFEQTFVTCVERIHEIYSVKRKASKRIFVVWDETGKSSNDYQTREKQEWAKEEPKLDTARELTGIYFVDPDDEEYQEILKNARRKLERFVSRAPCRSKYLQMASRKWLRRWRLHPKRFQKRFMSAQWNLMNPQGNKWNLLSLKVIKTS